MTELETGAVAETVPAVGPKMADLIVAYLNQLLLGALWDNGNLLQIVS